METKRKTKLELGGKSAAAHRGGTSDKTYNNKTRVDTQKRCIERDCKQN